MQIMLSGDGARSGDWEEVTISAEELAQRVDSGVWYRCTLCNYEDGLPAYHFKED